MEIMSAMTSSLDVPGRCAMTRSCSLSVSAILATLSVSNSLFGLVSALRVHQYIEHFLPIFGQTVFSYILPTFGLKILEKGVFFAPRYEQKRDLMRV